VLTFDFSPLSGTVDRQAVATLRRESIAAGVKPFNGTDQFAFWLSVIGWLGTAALLAFIDFGSVSLFAKVSFTVVVGAINLFYLFTMPLWSYRLAVRWTEFFRVKRFAAVNQLTYADSESKPTWNSLLFNKKADKYHTYRVFTSTREPVFEAGTYVYEVWVDKKLVAVGWGYIVVDLGRPVASMVLRSRSRASNRRWAAGAYSRNPVVSLGPDIDRRFRLYCPTGAEDDARRIFTPGLVAALRKLGRSVDVEVSDRFLFVYSKRRFAFPRPRDVKDVFAIISLVSAQAGTA
jgi:hypothetical protein